MRIVLLISVIVLGGVSITNQSFAYPGEMYYIMHELNRMQGTWYDTNGKEAYVFSNGYVNGNKITNLYDLAGGSSDFGCKLDVIVGGISETWKLSFTNLRNGPAEYHQYMDINGASYRRTPAERYFESVGGIYLGMPIEQVKALYGQPTITKDNGHGMCDLGYANLGMELDIRNNIVTQITIYSYGDRAFDRTGLTAKSSPSEFARAYGMSRTPGQFASKIGNNEYIWIRSNYQSATLSLYWN